MRKLQFSLLGLLGVVSFVAVGCAAMAKPNESWAIFVTNATFAALFVGVLAAIYGHAARRAFWVGFAVVGWGYLAVGWANATLSNARPDDAQHFVTTELLEWLGERTLQETIPQAAFTMTPPPAPVIVNTLPSPIAANDYAGNVVPIVPPPAPGATSLLAYLGPAVDQQALSRFMRIGHSLWAIVFAVAGGLLARAFYHRRERLATRAASSG